MTKKREYEYKVKSRVDDDGVSSTLAIEELLEARKKLWSQHDFEYDAIVIGGGPGGLYFAKEAQSFGAKIAIVDYTLPSSTGNEVLR